MAKVQQFDSEPALGVPYPYPPTHPQAQPQQAYYVGQSPYQAGMIPPNAVYGDPKGIPIQQTMYRDTPAPFNCVYCGSSGLTTVRFPSSSTLFDSRVRVWDLRLLFSEYLLGSP